MPAGTPRIDALDPSRFISLVESLVERGEGPRQDRFPYSRFHQELLDKGLDKDVVLLSTLRTAADHYMLNPTIIEVWDRNISALVGRRLNVHISVNVLKNVLRSSKIILKSLQN